MRTLTWTAILAVVSAASTLGMFQLFAQDGAALRVPLTLEYSEQTFLSTGEVRQVRLTHAVRDDGSTVEATQYRDEDGVLQEVRSIVDLDAATKTVVASAARSTTTYYYTEQQVGNIRGQHFQCADGVPTDDLVLGYHVRSRTDDLTTPLGDGYKSITYNAPELGCLPLVADLFKIGQDGSERRVKHTSVVAISLGEPDATLFVVPSDYAELSPAEYAATVAPSPDLDSNLLVDSLESNYRTNRSNIN